MALPDCRILLALVCFLVASTAVAAERPNIVVVFVDDMGWGDFSCFGNQDASTPQIDLLAKEGIRFEEAVRSSAQAESSNTSQ